MGINLFISQPSLLFKNSFASTDYPDQSWEDVLNKIFSTPLEVENISATSLIKHIEQMSSVKISQNSQHHITNLAKTQTTISELLASILIFALYVQKKAATPRIILSESNYYFICPNGEITQINSNKSRPLDAAQKFDLFNSNFQYLDFAKLTQLYFEELCALYIKKHEHASLISAHSFMIEFDPKEVKWFARRGLLQKQLGNYNDALLDLKRFTSFSNINDAPEAIKSALIELEGLKAFDNFNEFSIH